MRAAARILRAGHRRPDAGRPELPASARAHHRLRRHPRVRRRRGGRGRIRAVGRALRARGRRARRVRPEHRHGADHRQHGGVHRPRANRRSRRAGLRELHQLEERLPLEPRPRERVGAQLSRSPRVVGRRGRSGRRGVEAARGDAVVQRLRHPPPREHVLPRGGQPQRRRARHRRAPRRGRRRVLLQHALRAAAAGRRPHHGRHLQKRQGRAPAVQGGQGRHPRLRRLLQQPGHARLLRAGHEGLLAVHHVPRRQRAVRRHVGGRAHDADDAHEDDPRRARRRAPRDAVSVPRRPRRPLHGRKLLPHGLHEQLRAALSGRGRVPGFHRRQVLQHRAQHVGGLLRRPSTSRRTTATTR